MKITIGNGKRGITLIALIITVIVMLILAGVSISVLTGGGGLFEKTTSAAEEYNQSVKNEADTMQNWMNQLDSYLSGKLTTPGDTTNPTVATVVVSNVETTTFTLTATGEDETSILKYEFYINGILEDTVTTSETTATLNVTGKTAGTVYTCKVKVYNVANNALESAEITVTTIDNSVAKINGEWVASKGVNSPKLGAGMSAFYFDGSTEVQLTSSSSIEEWNKWYDYSASKWANAKTTDDGSYWVWVPRYAYKITSNYQTAFADENQASPSIDIVFVDNYNRNGETQYNIATNYEAVNTNTNYYVHPAFINDTTNGYTNGGWSSDLAGIWVAKFEASNIDDKPVSLPNKASWSGITIGTMYTNALNYKSGLESHLMKNSEWGATAYLGHSKYGLNGKNIAVNTTSYTTGAGSAWATTNVGQSTTGNVTGVYDMSGCIYEYTAGYVANENSNISSYGSSFASTATSPSSSKYVTVYKKGTSDTRSLNYSANLKKGDAIRETSSTGENSTSWYEDYSHFPYSNGPFFVRGGASGNGTGAGLFYFNCDDGTSASYYGFRVTLAV